LENLEDFLPSKKTDSGCAKGLGVQHWILYEAGIFEIWVPGTGETGDVKWGTAPGKKVSNEIRENKYFFEEARHA